MTQQLAGGVMRMFRLTNEPGGLGLSCTPTGVSLAVDEKGLPRLSVEAATAHRPSQPGKCLLLG